MMLTLFAAFPLLLQTPAALPPEVQARVAGTYVAVSLRMRDYADDEELFQQAVRELGDKAVMFGGFGREGATVSILAEREGDEHHESDWRRERILGEGGEDFEVAGIACREDVLALDGLRKLDFHAFPVAAGYCFDVHVSLLSPGQTTGFGRAEFSALIESFRVAFLRRGWREDYPEHALDVMHEAALRAPDGVAWLTEQQADDAKDYALPFVEGELLKVLGAPQAEVLAAFDRALPLFAALEEPSASEIFAWAVAEDGAGLSLANSGRLEEAIPHYRHGFALATQVRHRVRASLAYNLACACALTGEAEEALVNLRHAVEVDERYREVAREDADLVSLRENPEFLEILAR